VPGISRVHLDERRRLGNGLLDQASIESHPQGFRVDLRPCAGQAITGILQQDPDTLLFQDRQRGLVDGLDLVG